MNIKQELKNFGYFMITPVPAKFHFEGVDNKRATKQFLIVAAAAQVIVLTVAVTGPIVIEEIQYRKNLRKMKRLMKD